MKTNFYSKVVMLLGAVHFLVCTYAQVNQQAGSFSKKTGEVPLLFMENKGQIADEKGNPQPDILFAANSSGAKVFLTATSIHYQFSKTECPGKDYDKNTSNNTAFTQLLQQSSHRFTLELQNANTHPAIRKEQPGAYTENYYLAHCPGGIIDVPGYQKIVFENVYPYIDWIVYRKGGFMEYDFLVHSGGNASQIRLKVKDAESVRINAAGELVIKTSLGEVKEKAPVSYADGVVVATQFTRYNDGTIGFNVQSQPGKALRIDPSVTWATYYGSTGNDFSYSCATDANGNVYLAGSSSSATGIASGGFQNTSTGYPDAFLAKFNSAGDRLWSTYYGGSTNDNGRACMVDASGNVYLAGQTTSTTGIASNGFQNVHGDGGIASDAFLVKFSSSGSRLWATYYGGNHTDDCLSCMADGAGNVYLAGSTQSDVGIASGGFQNGYNGGYDAYIVKFSPDGNRLWGSYYGGSGYELGLSCAVDLLDNVYLSGQTNSVADIASGGFQNTNGDNGLNADAFLVKFNSAGGRLWATYYGGNSYDIGYCCKADGDGNVYLAGQTTSVTGIAFNGFQNTSGDGGVGGGDAFLVKLGGDGSRQWATYYGGNSGDGAFFCTVDAGSNVYLTGYTGSATGIASGGFQNNYGGGNSDAFLVKLNSNGSRVWATYYGGPGQENSNAAASDATGNIYLAGSTSSSTGISLGGFQNTYGGGGDAFLVKIDNTTILPVTIRSIAAYQLANNIQVEWMVQQENGIRIYEIEKSSDGISFLKAGEQTAGNNNRYQWLDVHPEAGNHFYRVRSVSADGKITYSRIIKVMLGKGPAGYQVYPNPVAGNIINLLFVNQPKGIYTVRLLNALSQVILIKKISHAPGSSAETIAVDGNLKKGAYRLQIIAPNNSRQSIAVVY